MRLQTEIPGTNLLYREPRNHIPQLLRDEYRDTHDGDAYGQCMAFWFAIADILESESTIGAPAEWEFRQSPCGADTDSYPYQIIKPLLDSGALTIADLEHFGNVLQRLRNWCAIAGVDY